MSIVKECRSFRPWIWNLGSLLKSGGWLTHTHSHTRSLDRKLVGAAQILANICVMLFNWRSFLYFSPIFVENLVLSPFDLILLHHHFVFSTNIFLPFFTFFLFAVLHSIFFSQIDIILGSMFIVCLKSSFIQFKSLFRFTEMNSSKRENMDLVRKRFNSEFQ